MKKEKIKSWKSVRLASLIGLFVFVFAAFAPMAKVEAQAVSGWIIVTPSTICAGETTTLKWSTSDATSITIDNGIGSVAPYGERTISPTQTTTYTMNLSNSAGGQNSGTATVTVTGPCGGTTPPPTPTPQPVVSISANPSFVQYNGSSMISWSSSNASYCIASNGSNGWAGNRNTSGTFPTGNLINTTTYTITCYNNAGSDTESTTVTVGNNITYPPIYPPIQPPIQPPVFQQPFVSLTADSTNLPFNGSTTLRWNTSNATSCNASGGSPGWAGPKSIGPASFFTGSLITGTRTYTLTCTNGYGTATDSVVITVRGQTIVTGGGTVTRPPAPASSLVIISSSVDRTQPILPTIDNTMPRPGDEINYTVTYQNIGTGTITNLRLQINLPQEVAYMFSNPSNPSRFGNTLMFDLGSLRANQQGTVTVRVKVLDNIPAGTDLNFPATLSYIDPAGFPQSVSANVSAEVLASDGTVSDEDLENNFLLGANVFGAGFLPDSLFGWLLLIILILLLVWLAKYLFGGNPNRYILAPANPPANPPHNTVIHH